jgi:drug/metabolite transporter (DMT)-like permease
MGEVVWVRYFGQLITMVLMLGLLAIPRLLQTKKLAAQIARSFLLLISTACNFVALRHLRLDQTTTIGFLTPLVVAVLAGPVLGERIGSRRAVAIVVGFGGILLALRPDTTQFHPAIVFSMSSMLACALFSLITRYLAPYDPPEVTLFYSLLAGTFLAAPFAAANWVWRQRVVMDTADIDRLL